MTDGLNDGVDATDSRRSRAALCPLTVAAATLEDRIRRFADAEFFRDRHANPASGWSRVPTGPLLLYAVYARNWRLLAAVVAFAGVNSILFPEREPADPARRAG